MEDIVTLVMNNCLGGAAFLFMVLYILYDKKQVSEEKKANQELFLKMIKSLDDNTDVLKSVSDNQKEMSVTLEKMNIRIENIENKKEKEN